MQSNIICIQAFSCSFFGIPLEQLQNPTYIFYIVISDYYFALYPTHPEELESFWLNTNSVRRLKVQFMKREGFTHFESLWRWVQTLD